MKVSELIERLNKVNPDKEVRVAVGWAKDTAISDEGEDIQISEEDSAVELRGWLSDCGTCL